MHASNAIAVQSDSLHSLIGGLSPGTALVLLSRTWPAHVSIRSRRSSHVDAQLGHVPAKLNTVIQPLVGGLRREGDAVVREAVAAAVAHLVILCTDRNPSPNDRQGLGLDHHCAAVIETLIAIR